jgi:hypothetical protein
LAAAAVVAIAVPVAVVAQRGATAPVPLAQVGDPVPAEFGPNVRFLPTDAGLPGAAAIRIDPRLTQCTAQQLTAVLDLAGDQLNVRTGPQGRACQLPGDLRVTLPGAVTVVREEQPEVPNPPDFSEGQFLHAAGIALNARWTGRCDALPTSGTLDGTGLTVAFPVQGTPAGCGTGDPALRVGPAHLANRPGGVVPRDRADLDVTLQLPEEVSRGAEFEYQVSLANPTGHDVSLRPCPTFATRFIGNGTGGGGYGRLPCDRLPDTLHARQKVAVLMTERTWGDQPAQADSRSEAEVTWQIAGTPKATGTLDVVDRAPKVLPPVPYLAPSGQPPAKSSFRYPAMNGPFPVVIEGPATVRVGETLRYKVVFTNPPGGPTVPLRPCPRWTELVAQAPKVTNRPKILERTGAVNCAQAPDHIGPGEQITFEMERLINADTPPGAYQLYWQIHNGMTSAPFDLDVQP